MATTHNKLGGIALLVGVWCLAPAVLTTSTRVLVNDVSGAHSGAGSHGGGAGGSGGRAGGAAGLWLALLDAGGGGHDGGGAGFMGEGSQAARAVDVLIECACSSVGVLWRGNSAGASVGAQARRWLPLLGCSLRAVFAEVRRGLAGCGCGRMVAGVCSSGV